MKKELLFIFTAALPFAASAQTVHRMSLADCIDYAMAHNLTLLTKRAAEQTADVDVKEAEAARMPSLSGSLTQGLTYRPFQETGGSFVNGGIASSAADKATQSGSYGVNAQWTVWNGGRTKMNLESAQMAQTQSRLATEQAANTIKEQLANYYVQILYMQEAEKVNNELLTQDSALYERGRVMVEQQQMSKADLALLASQVSQGRYNVVNVGTQIADAKRQLKQLLQLPASDELEVTPVSVTDERVLAALPTKATVYENALAARAEVKSAELSVEQSKLTTKMARAAYYPTVSLTAGIGDSHLTGTSTNFFNQMKNNFNTNVGVSVNIPILDNRKTKSSIERAKLAETTAELTLSDTQRALYENIERYWLDATNNRAKYAAAKDNAEALTTSYGLTTEQFRLGLKNMAELLNGRANLLQAQQQMLQDKYTALLNRALLSFYGGETLNF